MKCKYCSHACVKAGVRNKKMQTYRCKACKKYQQKNYSNQAYLLCTNQKVIRLLIEGISVRGIARVLKISVTTVIARIKWIAHSINKTYSQVKNRIYEIDELWTFVGRKKNEVWITYAMDRSTKEVIGFHVGTRTKDKLEQVTSKVLMRNPKRVCTDGLVTYKSLIPKELHRVGLPNTRHIERFNLNLRTHLKRLSRKTICFSKSKEMLEACLKIYFWSARLALYEP
jgi:insertion element IS1 protein InsB